ncbi:SusD/RagB family nutrient-binding outer membrane lipoprotein [Prolixibacteraceae bacterium JC049]|nr:SusD/RagB family nutrient-binding outer membrane lipoprotein [Prolixibacteraceae bacterium JC049]
MKTKTIIKGVFVLAMSLGLTNCTDNFEDLNTNPYKITGESLEQDYNDIGAYYPNMLRMVVNTTHWRYQIAQNLCSDSWAAYLAAPTPFAGGTNNTTYKMVWKDHAWNSSYEGIMAPAKKIIELAQEKKKPQFEAWAKLIRIYGMQRVASLHGPIIYSDYGKSATTSKYDAEETLYTNFFTELDEVMTVLTEYKDFKGFKRFDVAYKGDITKWLKLANTLRLKLAIRISNIKPDLAKTQAEKAVANEFGLIVSNDDNFNVDLGGTPHPLSTICYSWGDTRMSATMESFLVGYHDGRVGKMFAPIADADMALVTDHAAFPYKGIKNGAKLVAKERRVSYSKVGEFFQTTPYHTLVNAAEVNFMLAEGKLRGWNMGGKTAQQYYEDGIRTSFTQWGASGADEYLANNALKPINYKDPKGETPTENAFDAQTEITIAWDDAAANEVKLERIITQKWIAGFPDSYEAWSDFRRTGYPKIEPVYQNDSNESDGTIANGDYIKRMRFIEKEYASNQAGVADAVTKLGGPDKINTSLWWDKVGSNF